MNNEELKKDFRNKIDINNKGKKGSFWYTEELLDTPYDFGDIESYIDPELVLRWIQANFISKQEHEEVIKAIKEEFKKDLKGVVDKMVLNADDRFETEQDAEETAISIMNALDEVLSKYEVFN
jgi:hypothetical protein